jgi:hypothetical protein
MKSIGDYIIQNKNVRALKFASHSKSKNCRKEVLVIV